MAASSPWVGSSGEPKSQPTPQGSPSSRSLIAKGWDIGPQADRTLISNEAQHTAFLQPAFVLATALMLLFSPHYPWYVAWLIPFFALMPNLPLLAYIMGLFYLCTTALAEGYGPRQFLLNQLLYGGVALATLIYLALRRWPILDLRQPPRPSPLAASSQPLARS